MSQLKRGRKFKPEHLTVDCGFEAERVSVCHKLRTLTFHSLGVLKECVVPIVCKEQVNALYDCGKKLAEPITEERIARECSKEVAHLW